MKFNTYYWKKIEAGGPEKRSNAKNLISVDQPFDYEDVVATTGSEYVRNLHSDGVILIPYEELRRNYAVFNLPEEESLQWMAELFDLCCEYA